MAYSQHTSIIILLSHIASGFLQSLLLFFSAIVNGAMSVGVHKTVGDFAICRTICMSIGMPIGFFAIGHGSTVCRQRSICKHAIGFTIGDGMTIFLDRFDVPLAVGLYVEGGEHVEEEQWVGWKQGGYAFGVGTRWVELNLDCVNKDDAELYLEIEGRPDMSTRMKLSRRSRTYHLHYGQVTLPPQVLLPLRTHGADHVVEVHDHVDEGVDQTQQSGLST